MKSKLLIILVSLLITSNICEAQRTLTGIENLRNDNFEMLKGKKIGLITNPTGVDYNLKSTVDILNEAKGVELVALFSPEHGVRGNISAGDKVDNFIDEKTKLPVYSLYGKNNKPDSTLLSNIDILVYDIQDIGVRSYTYISTMGLSMEAAAENNLEFIVLDRPNPLGGKRIEGAMVSEGYYSFISQYNIPYVYGLTPGELAIYLNEEGLLNNSVKCKLEVVKLKNWQRSYTFNKTGLPWVATSPHIPTVDAALLYAATGILGELVPNTIGIGYTLPFQVLAEQGIDNEKLLSELNKMDIKGITFRPLFFKPYYMKEKGKDFAGVQIHISNYDEFELTSLQFKYMEALHIIYPEINYFEMSPKRHRMFDLGCGTDQIRIKFQKEFKYKDIKTIWEKENKTYRKKIKKYFLY